jgi:hypothetical protein
MACREALRRLDDTLGLREDGLIRLSQRESLDRDGDCWELSHMKAFWTMLTYLDPESGTLLLLWTPPEG